MRPRFAPTAVRTLLALLISVPLLAATAAPGKPAPDFTLTANNGSKVTLSKLKGQVVMINFWATWCGPCRQEMPLLEDIHKKYSKMGFTLLGVNVEPDSKAADKWIKQNTKVTFPILYDTESTVSELYNVNGMPSTIFVDRKGNMRLFHQGYKPGDENEYLNQIRALIRE
jgi:peroxiredoxin